MKCERCGSEHDGSFGSGRFCNRSCANSRGPMPYEIKKKISETLSGGNEYLPLKRYNDCLYCGKSFKKGQKKFCDNRCKGNYYFEDYIDKWKRGLIDGSRSGGNAISTRIRRYLWEKYNGKCSRCGWNTPNPYVQRPILEIEHIDGNSTNNNEENLDLICPNCHSLTATYKALNSGNGNKDRLRYYKLI